MIRLFIAESTPPFAVGLVVALNPDQGRYLTAVMRLRPGDEVLLFNGRDGEWRARLHEVTKRLVTLELLRQERPQAVAVRPPVLIVALIKRVRLETIVEKATELGAGEIRLAITRRTNADHTNVARLQLIAQEAAEQTGRLDVPEVIKPVKLETCIETLRPGERIVYGDELSATETGEAHTPSMAEALSSVETDARVFLLIGPEGGFDEGERSRLRAHPQALAVNLGPRILRADTAAIAALTLYQALAGDWRQVSENDLYTRPHQPI